MALRTRTRFLRRKIEFSVCFLTFFSVVITNAQCPPKESIKKCTCLPLDGEPEKLQVLCDGVELAEVSSKFNGLGPIDLTVQNGGFGTVPRESLRQMNLGKLSFINNGLTKLAVGDFSGFSSGFHELFFREPSLKVIEEKVFDDLPTIQKLTVQDSEALERIPKLSGLKSLTSVSILNSSVKFLEANTLFDLPNLRDVDLTNNDIEIFDMRTLGELPSVKKLDLTGNELSDISFLPIVLRNLPNLNFLFLQSNKIQKVPQGFLDGLNSILLIDLSKNQIKTLPENLVTSGPSTLRELYLGQNFISELPAQVFNNVTGLKTLSLANNSINVLEKQMAPLKDLLYLRLEGNRLQRIASEAFRTMSRVQTLSLEGNQLTVLENGVFIGLNDLQTLDLSRNYLQEFRGTEIKSLPNLQNLLFGGNRLRNLYAGFDSLVALKRLDLSNNQLSNIDDNTFADLKSLENLQLDGNLFMKVPLNALTKLSALERLTLSGNRLQSLPAFKAIGHLKHLALDHNSIPDVASGAFATLPDLRQLFLNNNRIRSVQEGAFTNLYTLYVLDLSHNIIESIGEKVFDNLVSLETLDLSANQLDTLRDGTLGNVPLLRAVDFSQNHIGVVANNAFQNVPHLMQVNMSKNFMNAVPATLSRLEKLRRLDLSWNRIRRIEDPNFVDLQAMENLYIQRNPVCFLGEKAFATLTRLNYVDMSYMNLRHIPQTAFRATQDFAGVVLEGNDVDCDCDSKWLRTVKPDLRCGFPRSVMSMKVSQVNPDVMSCQKEDKVAGNQCTMLPIYKRPTRPISSGTVSPNQAVEEPLATTEDPEGQVLAKGSYTQAWLTQSEIDARAQELSAIQQAKQISNPNAAANSQILSSLVICLIVFSLFSQFVLC